MRGLRYYGDRRCGVEEFPVPVIGEGEVLVEVAVSALCGSERSDYEQGCGFISGHEFTGIVRETNKCGRIKCSDRVTINVLKGCGNCYYCRIRQPQFCKELRICQGGHAEYAAVPESSCILLPEDMDFTAGVLLGGDTLGVAYRAVGKLHRDFGKEALVLGAGPIGLGVISLLKYYGYHVIVSETNPLRAALAKRLADADEVFSPDEASGIGRKGAEERIFELTNGLGADFVLECSGNPGAEQSALEFVRPAGTVVFCGENYKGLYINPSLQIIHKEITLTGAFYFAEDDFHGLYEIYKRGFNPKSTVSHVWELAEAAHACDMFFSGKTGKVLLERRN